MQALFIPNFALRSSVRRIVAHKKKNAKFAFGCGLPQGLTPHVSKRSRHAALWADFTWPSRSLANVKSGFNRDSLMFFRKIVRSFIALTFLTSLIVAPAGAQVLPVLNNPVSLAAGYQPPVLLGLKIHPENPLLFDFIVDQGQAKLSTDELKEETTKLVKYFLAALTIPDKEVWVNLSPTEKDRIIPDVLGQTTMGKTMLEQDYVLKQLAASLTNPETDLGKKYWTNVGNGLKPFPTMETSQTALNKVWIMPEKAEVLESNGIVLVGEKRLKVMMAEDRSLDGQNSIGAMAAKNNVGSGFKPDQDRTGLKPVPTNEINNISSQIFRTTILPTIEKEVNEGKDFADVRQIYNSVILAAWYKKALKESLLGKIYTDKGKVAGVETDDKQMKQRIYEQYLAAFKKGAYNLIKEEADENGELIPKKYFSGGIADLSKTVVVRAGSPLEMQGLVSSTAVIVRVATPEAKTLEVAAAQAQTAASETGDQSNSPDVSSSAVQVFRQLAVAVGFSLMTLFPTVYSLPADAQSLQFSDYYLKHQAEFDKSVPRVGNIAQAQEELRKNFNQMIAASKKKHGGPLVPDSVEAPRLKQISGDVQTFDGLVDVSKKELARLASDNNSKAQFQKELLKWWYSFLDENTEYDLQGVRMNNKELDDLRKLVVGGVGSKKRTGVCQGYAILTTQVFNEFGYPVSSIEVKVNSKGENMQSRGGHMANLWHSADGQNGFFDMAQRGVNLPHQVVVDKDGKEYSVKPGDPLLGKINGWSADDIRQSQDKAILLSKGLQLLKKVQDENSRAIKLSKDGKATQSQPVWAQIVVDIDAFLKENTGALQKINSLDPLFQKSFSIDGKNAGGSLLMNVLNEQKGLAQSNLTSAQQTSSGGKNVVTFSGDAADMNYINGLVNRLNEASRLVGKNRDLDAQKALTEIVNELSGSKVKELEARAKSQGPQGKGILEVLENMRKTAAGNLEAAQKNLVIAQNNKAIQQENAIISQFNIIGEDYNNLVAQAKKNPNIPVGKFVDIKGRLDQMIKDYPQMSDRLKVEVQKLRSLVESVINSRSSKGAQNDLSIPALALENLEPQLLAGQTVEWQGQSTAASSGVNDFKININPQKIKTITGPENIISAISNGDIIGEAVNVTKKIAGTKILELQRYETTQGAVNQDNEIVIGKNLVVKEILYADGAPVKIRFYHEGEDSRYAMTVAIDKIVSLTIPAASSTVAEERSKLVNQPLTDQAAIIDAFTLKGEVGNKDALFRKGDKVKISFILFLGDKKGEDREVEGEITEINRQTIGQSEPVTRFDTLVRVKGFGINLSSIKSITLVAPAASSAVDVQDVEVDKRIFWVDKFWRALHSRKRNIPGMYDLGKQNLVKIAQIGDLRWVGIYDQKEKRWFELVVDSYDKPLAYGASMIPIQSDTDSIFLTFNVLSDVQRRRLALGKDKIDSWDILQGRMHILKTITGRKSFIVQGKQIFGREAIERTAAIFYLKHGFHFINPVNSLISDLNELIKKGEHLADYQINALAHSGPMIYELPDVSSTSVNNSSASTVEDGFTKGGIDFDPTNMNLQIKRDGKGVPLPLPQQNLEQINIQGLFPVIINITPINAQTLPIFLGQVSKEPVKEPELAANSAG